MASYLPQHDGYLPYFLLLTSFMAAVHSIVCYLSPPSTALQQFSGLHHPAPTPLLAHVYGVKNIYTSLIRAYAAYHINVRALYNLATFTYVGVLFLFITELLVWKTTRMQEAVFPLINAGVGLFWTVTARHWYLSH
ncbi:ergosterol biosynthesis protein-like protein Erg28 [Massarina eburnea CBS 473.64]|uniref:Ergosterol biosynthesis protein-like protein Erg28 n=1 Tax=Massarina eburnea CBS 473.64 TaxID=1395130 RepID=A0A6A6RLV3_9PLEO|nr:ergosterol biosynthesis protein-like protein Erg28 [Massarina eburnea CBS 473.64]